MYVCHTLITQKVHGRFYLLNFEKEMVVLENKPWRSLDLLLMKKMTAYLKSKRKNTGYTRDLHGQYLSGKGCWSIL